MLQAQSPQNPNGILLQAANGLADHTHDASLKVGKAFGVVNELVGNGVVEQAVDGEVPSLGILLGRTEKVVSRGEIVAVFIFAQVATKSGDLELRVLSAHQHQAKALADNVGAVNGVPHLIRFGVGGNVEVFGMNAQEQVANAAADQIGGMAPFLEGADNSDRMGVNPVLMQVGLLGNVHWAFIMSYLENFHHQITGNPTGHKLVFLHGLMGSAANWRRIIPSFEGQYHVLAFDQRGHGRSFQPSGGYHPRDYAMDLKKILDELGWEEVALVGHSMGGRNALEFASRFSQRVNALVLEDIAPEASSLAVNNIERLLELVPTPFATREEAKDFFDQRYPSLISFYPKADVVARFLFTNIETKSEGGFNWRFSKSAVLQSLREGRNEDRWDALRNLKMPVLIVRGENSTDLTHETFAKMLAVLPSARGVEVPDSGHWVHFDQPDIFVHLLKDFLTCLPGSVY